MDKRTFAFKLAAQKNVKKNPNKRRWQVRHGVAAAGCTEYGRFGVLRDDRPGGGLDDGGFC